MTTSWQGSCSRSPRQTSWSPPPGPRRSVTSPDARYGLDRPAQILRDHVDGHSAASLPETAQTACREPRPWPRTPCPRPDAK
eukprot:871571-Heterocapsa_arctica.AAC.1